MWQKRDLEAKDHLNKLRDEFRLRERKLKQDMKELKVESHLTITGLQAQLAEIKKPENNHLTAVKEEVTLPILGGELDCSNSRVVVLESEKTEISKSLLKAQIELKAQQLIIEELKQRVSDQVIRLREQGELLLKNSEPNNEPAIQDNGLDTSTCTHVEESSTVEVNNSLATHLFKIVFISL